MPQQLWHRTIFLLNIADAGREFPCQFDRIDPNAASEYSPNSFAGFFSFFIYSSITFKNVNKIEKSS